MGMYTQVRGWLNVDSIGHAGNLLKITEQLHKAQDDFENDKSQELDRKWVCRDTIANQGGNGSVYLFFGTELKDYSSSAYKWIKYLLKYFPTAEGRMDFQYEEERYWENINLNVETQYEINPYYKGELEGSESRYLLIRKGKVRKDGITRTWCEGYGNMYEL